MVCTIGVVNEEAKTAFILVSSLLLVVLLCSISITRQLLEDRLYCAYYSALTFTFTCLCSLLRTPLCVSHNVFSYIFHAVPNAANRAIGEYRYHNHCSPYIRSMTVLSIIQIEEKILLQSWVFENVRRIWKKKGIFRQLLI